MFCIASLTRSHLAIGVMRARCTEPTLLRTLPIDEQASHSKATGQRYAWSSDNNTMTNTIDEYEWLEVSLLWQRILAICPSVIASTTTTTTTLVPPSSLPPAPCVTMASPVARAPPPPPVFALTRKLTPDVLAVLREMHGPKATFSTVHQRDAVLHVLQPANCDLLLISPTGSGKTLTYTLPAKLLKKTIVVIVPLSGLKLDLELRGHAYKINLAIFPHQSLTTSPDLLLVSPEEAGKDTFATYLKTLEQSHRLALLVYEEVHLFLTSAFRAHLLPLLSLSTTAPKLFLTATLPAYLEKELLRLTASDPRVLRSNTSRPNIAYLVHRCSSKASQDDTFVTLVVNHHKNLAQKERIVVYVRKIDDCRRLQEKLHSETMLKATVFNSSLSEDDKSSSYHAWRKGQATVMIATCGFGTGIDYQWVRLVLSYGGSSSLLDFAQESGRAGRDGNPALSITLYYSGSQREIPIALDEVDTFWPWAESTGCLRKHLQHYLDGSGDDCLGLRGVETCSNCLHALTPGKLLNL